ncbi:glycosyl hydrolase [Niallia sp. FSL K6-0077]|uniref:glycosyl hydrolase n=1 Tax=Niallia sp. FSL K6-0077 TaxID=2954743 RepID=UPI0030F7F29C
MSSESKSNNKRKFTVILLLLLFITIIIENSFNHFFEQAEKKKQEFSIYEAEDGIMKGVKVLQNKNGYSGDGFVSNFNSPNDFIEFRVSVKKEGEYIIKIGYLVPKGWGDKRTKLIINGESIGEKVLIESNVFTETTWEIIKLNQGVNKIKLISNWGNYDIDYIKVKPATNKEINSISKKPVNPNATKKTKKLMSYLVNNYEKKIISGQQNMAFVDWINDITGKKPAIVGFDFKDYSTSLVKRGIKSYDVLRAIEWDKQGGIVQFQWHWNAPKDLIAWERGFYSDATNFNVEYAFNHPKSTEYKLILEDIDAIAIQLKRLQSENIPVLFRPLHEAEGGWFWWGSQGPEPAKKLYRLVYDRLTYYHKLNNLIWIWNSSSPEWYPGDKYVDIVSYNYYPKDVNYGSVKNEYERMVNLVSRKKIVTMSENGPIPNPQGLIEDKAYWSWFLTWDSYVKTKNSATHLQEVYNNSNVITLDDLPNFNK